MGIKTIKQFNNKYIFNNDYTAFQVYANDETIPVGSNSILGGYVSIEIPPQMTETFIIRTNKDNADNDVIIDWGDNTISKISNNEQYKTLIYDNEIVYILRHTYVISQKYVIKIFGRDYFAIAHALADFDETLNSEENLVCKCLQTDLPLASHIVNLSSAFDNSQRLLHVNIPYRDTINQVINFSKTFRNCHNLLSASGLSRAWANIHAMSSMFLNCENMVSCDLVLPDSMTFYHGYRNVWNGCKSLINNINNMLPTIGFTNKDVDMDCTFKNCQSLTGQVPSRLLWEQTKVNWLNVMNCFKYSSLVNQVPTTWGGTNTSIITDIELFEKTDKMPQPSVYYQNKVLFYTGEKTESTDPGKSYKCVKGFDTYIWQEISVIGLGKVDNVSNITSYSIEEDGINKNYLFWKDPEDKTIEQSVVQWDKTVVVGKSLGYPNSISDGTIVAVETIKNQYQISPLILNDEFQYYRFFTYTKRGAVNDDSNAITNANELTWSELKRICSNSLCYLPSLFSLGDVLKVKNSRLNSDGQGNYEFQVVDIWYNGMKLMGYKTNLLLPQDQPQFAIAPTFDTSMKRDDFILLFYNYENKNLSKMFKTLNIIGWEVNYLPFYLTEDKHGKDRIWKDIFGYHELFYQNNEWVINNTSDNSIVVHTGNSNSNSPFNKLSPYFITRKDLALRLWASYEPCILSRLGLYDIFTNVGHPDLPILKLVNNAIGKERIWTYYNNSLDIILRLRYDTVEDNWVCEYGKQSGGAFDFENIIATYHYNTQFPGQNYDSPFIGSDSNSYHYNEEKGLVEGEMNWVNANSDKDDILTAIPFYNKIWNNGTYDNDLFASEIDCISVNDVYYRRLQISNENIKRMPPYLTNSPTMKNDGFVIDSNINDAWKIINNTNTSVILEYGSYINIEFNEPTKLKSVKINEIERDASWLDRMFVIQYSDNGTVYEGNFYTNNISNMINIQANKHKYWKIKNNTDEQWATLTFNKLEIQYVANSFDNLYEYNYDWSLARVTYGSNEYEHNAIDQWLNLSNSNNNTQLYDVITQKSPFDSLERNIYKVKLFQIGFDQEFLDSITESEFQVRRGVYPYGNKTLKRKFYLPSTAELGLISSKQYEILGQTLPFYENKGNSSRIKYDASGNATPYWTRTPVEQGRQFRVINNLGQLYLNNAYSTRNSITPMTLIGQPFPQQHGTIFYINVPNVNKVYHFRNPLEGKNNDANGGNIRFTINDFSAIPNGTEIIRTSNDGLGITFTKTGDRSLNIQDIEFINNFPEDNNSHEVSLLISGDGMTRCYIDEVDYGISENFPMNFTVTEFSTESNQVYNVTVWI